jgi:hypothetical protein
MKARYLILILLCISSLIRAQSELDHLLAIGQGIIGYDTMYFSKKLGKQTTNALLPKNTFSIPGTPNNTAQAIAAVDFKLAFNDGAKRVLKMLLPALSDQKSLPNTLFGTANKGLTLGEFYEKMKEMLDELKRITLNESDTLLPSESSSITVYVITMLQDLSTSLYEISKLAAHRPDQIAPALSHSINSLHQTLSTPFFAIIKNTFNYFHKVTLATMQDPNAASIAALYLATAWTLCTLTRYLGNEFTRGIAHPLSLFKKGNAPFDQLMKTTIGMFLSSLAEKPIRSYVLMESDETTNTTKLRDLAWRAGIKGPFGLDGYHAIVAGLSVYLPKFSAMLHKRQKVIALSVACYVIIIALNDLIDHQSWQVAQHSDPA